MGHQKDKEVKMIQNCKDKICVFLSNSGIVLWCIVGLTLITLVSSAVITFLDFSDRIQRLENTKLTYYEWSTERTDLLANRLGYEHRPYRILFRDNNTTTRLPEGYYKITDDEVFAGYTSRDSIGLVSCDTVRWIE